MAAILFFLLSSVVFAQIVPKVDLNFWNDDYDITGSNNCYNYGTNRVTNNYAQPGEASGISNYDMECNAVLRAASMDLGLTPTAYFPYTSKADDSLIAVVVAPGYDYHWYRRGDDGMWTHKMGGTPASDVDERGRAIPDVTTADRGDYTNFCGYFRLKNYVYQSHEQDGGYVRIGDMTNLPNKPKNESIVQILKYSGLHNPEIKLRDVLADEQFHTQLVEVAQQLSVSALAVATPDQVRQLEGLGYNGVLIIDREGLIFPKNSRVQIKGAQTLAHFQGVKDPISWTIREPLRFERRFAPRK